MRALVLGINGQDGSFLAEHLIRRGYQVTGIGRQEYSLSVKSSEFFDYRCLDLRDTSALELLLSECTPDVIFHMAAVHGSDGTSYEKMWPDMLAVNMGSVQVVLEYLRTEAKDSIFVYASSGKVFGPEYPQSITETSSKSSSCLYTITKMGAQGLIDYYRDRYKVRASTLFLFNHESYRRSKEYFIPIVVELLRKSLSDAAFQGEVKTLKFCCDWGSAEEYMDIAVDVAEKAAGEDFILGTGTTWWAESFVETLFLQHGLDYRKHIIERQNGDAALSHSSLSFHVDIAKLRALVGRIPEIDLVQVCERILEHEA